MLGTAEMMTGAMGTSRTAKTMTAMPEMTAMVAMKAAMGLQAAAAILEAPDPLRALRDLSQDFPARAAGLSAREVPDDVRAGAERAFSFSMQTGAGGRAPWYLYTPRAAFTRAVPLTTQNRDACALPLRPRAVLLRPRARCYVGLQRYVSLA